MFLFNLRVVRMIMIIIRVSFVAVHAGTAYQEMKMTKVYFVCHRNRKLLISRVPTKAKSREPAYSQALNQNKIDRQWSRSRESGRQTVRRLWWMVFGVETGREVWG